MDPMNLYKQLSALGPGPKGEADRFMAELTSHYSEKNPAPNELISKGLEKILHNHRGSAHKKSEDAPWVKYTNLAAAVALLYILV